MNAIDPAESTPAALPAAAIRAASVCGIVGILLVAVIIGAQLVGAFNPYQDATDQVKTLLQIQPDLEARLDYIELARTRLQAYLDTDAAYAVTEVGSSAQKQLIEALAPAGIRGTDVRTFTSLLDSAAVELLALRTELQQEELAAPLKPLFYQIRQQPEIIDSERLNQIHEISPKVVEDLNDLRRRLLSISNNIRLITESSQLQPIAEALAPGASASLSIDPEARAYFNSYAAWKSLPEANESLEIQFAGTVSILDDIFNAVNTAQMQDRRWGFSTWEPAAMWVNSHLGITIVTAVALLLAAGVLLLRSRPGLTRLEQIPNQDIQRLFTNLVSSLKHTRPASNLQRPRADQGAVPAAPILTQPVRRRTLNQAGESANPRLLVLWPNGERKNHLLDTDKAFRIGSDPRNPVFIDNRDAGYIEIWVRGARAGHFVEVMFCESPVMLNRQPISGARALHDGDILQVLDLSLLYFEN